MKVERSSLEQVKKRFETNKKKLEEKSKNYDFEERVQELQEEVRWSQSVFFSRNRNLWGQLGHNFSQHLDQSCP